MRTFHVAQRGPKGVAFGFLISPALDVKLQASLPGWTVLTSVDGSPQLTQAELDAGFKLSGMSVNSPTLIFGWSAGCQPVRTALQSSLVRNLVAIACFDGTASSWPKMKPADIALWAGVMDRARRGEIIAILTCSSMTYVEHLTPAQGGPYAATRHVLEAALGATLEAGAPVHEEGLYVERYASEDIDAPAHVRQVQEVMPRLLRGLVGNSVHPGSILRAFGADILEAIKPAVDLVVEPLVGIFTEPHSDSARMIAWCRKELADNVREVPPGSNSSPRIDQYFSVPEYRRQGMPLKIRGVAWCAAAQSMCHHECGHPEIPPFVSGIEFETWAKSQGRLAGADTKPQPGWLAIYKRSVGGQVGWERHVTRVTEVHSDGSYETIGGNQAGDKWGEDIRHPAAHDTTFSSFVMV